VAGGDHVEPLALAYPLGEGEAGEAQADVTFVGGVDVVEVGDEIGGYDVAGAGGGEGADLLLAEGGQGVGGDGKPFPPGVGEGGEQNTVERGCGVFPSGAPGGGRRSAPPSNSGAMERPKATVLPEPVWAETSKSRPAVSSARTALCTGVGAA
jgi:hypothetical protein